MTITSFPSRDEYTSSAGQTVFNYSFKIYESSDLNVYVTPAGQTANDATDITTAYAVDTATIGNSAGGFITFSSPQALNSLITIVSDIPTDRTVDYQVNGDFIPATVNDDIDRSVSLIKQIKDLASRTLLFASSEQNAANLSLPNPISAALLRWKTDLSGLENITTSSLPSGVLVSQDLGIVYNTVAALKAATDDWLIPGQIVTTKGYYAAGDGGGATYLVAASQTVDGYGDHVLADSNVALLQGKPTALSYGVRVGGLVDAVPALHAALAALGSDGGSIEIPQSGQILIDTNLTIPPRTTLTGGFTSAGLGGLTNQTGSDYASMGSTLIINPLATISIGGLSGLTNLLCYRKGMTFPTTDSSLFTGTAITVIGDDAIVHDSLVIGFGVALTSNQFSRLSIKGFKWDCDPGVGNASMHIENSFDSSRLTSLSGWPFATIEAYSDALDGGSTPAAEAYRLHRAGSGLRLRGSNDDTFIDPILIYGYDLNYDFASSSSYSLGLIWSDNTGFHTGSEGIKLGNNTAKVSARELVSWSSDFNLVIDLLPTEAISIGKVLLAGGKNQNALFSGGDITIDAMESVGSAGAAFRVTDTDARIKIGSLSENGNTFGQVVDVGVASVNSNSLIIDKLFSDKAAGGSLVGTNITVSEPIASADPLNLPLSGDFFNVTGTTGFGGLNSGWGGREVTLKFSGALTVFDGGSMNLAGNFSATANDILTLRHDGSSWLEVSRSNN